ncbi:MAG TPA: response regulator [Anaerolineales bacterium]|nr:response regulator [Anaerolineales bacterium]
MDALNILLVDDDRNLATTLSYGLRKAMGKANSVIFCSSGPEAVALLATQSFDVVISDFHMPGISGLELLKKVRQDHRETSLVLITAYGTDTLEEEVHQLGFGYVTKPFEMPILLKSIDGLIQGKGTREGTKQAPRIVDPNDDTDLSSPGSNAK